MVITANPPKFDKRQPSRGDYDAIVYIDGSQVIAEDSNGRKMASGVAGTDDATVIQAALTSYDDVLCIGDFILSADLTLKSHNTLRGLGEYLTTFESSSTARIKIYAEDKDYVTLENFKMKNYVYAYVNALTVDVNYPTLRDIVGGCRTYPTFYFNVASYPATDGTLSMRGLSISNCTAIDGASGFIFVSIKYDGALNHAWHRDVSIINSRAINCGRDYRRGIYDIGFGFDGSNYDNVRVVACHAEGCFESGFHAEYSITKQGMSFIGCTSKNNGQKTKESKGLIEENDLTQTTPITCSFTTKTSKNPTYAQVEKSPLHCRIVSSGDTITAFSVTFIGVDPDDVPINETITEATPGITDESDGWSFYTSASFKPLTAITSVTVNSVTGAASGDYISVGQDAVYGCGFLLSHCCLVGCSTKDELNGFWVPDAVLVACRDYDSDTPFVDDSGKKIQCSKFVSGTETVVPYKTYVEHFMDCLAASATAIRSNEDLSAAVPLTFTLDAQPDIPRKLVWAFDAHVNITAFSITFTGVNAKGRSITQTITEASGWTGTTNEAFATITSIIMTARTGTGAGDTIDIGTSDIIGLANEIDSPGSTKIVKVKKNNANYPAGSFTASSKYDTVDLSTGGAITGGDDFTVWYMS